jgi:hypothetical protein
MAIIWVLHVVKQSPWILRGLALVPGLLLCGCALTGGEKGALVGGGLGAGTGALVGSAVGHPGVGALVGGGVGAVAGAVTGDAIDRSEQRGQARLAAATAAPPPGPLGVTDVVQMTHQHISDDIIVGQIRATNSVYHLSSQDIIWLKENGVSDLVIREMQTTACRAPRRYYAPAPAYAPVVYQPVYVEPPPRVRVGFGYTHGGCR